MKLYRDQHYGKLDKETIEKIRNIPKHIISSFLLAFIAASMFNFLPLAHGQTLHNYHQALEVRYANQDTIDSYEQIINNTVTMIKKLGISNPDDIFFLITFLIHEGFFSIDTEFQYQKENNWDVKGYEGMDIVKGYGVCRHEAEFLNRVLNGCGYDSNMVLCYLYYPDEDPSIWEESNHAVVTLKEKNGFKIYDPTNWGIGVSNDGLTIDLESSYNIDLKPFDSYRYGYTDIKGAFELFNLINRDLLGDVNLNAINNKDLSSIKNECYNQNLPFIEDICYRQEVKYGRNSLSK